MLSKATVKEALHTFVNELEECLRYQCYLAAALMAITVPDICAAAEADDGEASSQRYRRWCTRYLNDAFLSGEEWYDLRCVILHQGRTLARSKAVRYRRYVLSPPGGSGITLHQKFDSSIWRQQNHERRGCHRVIPSITGLPDLEVDIGALADSIERGIDTWAMELENNPKTRRAQNTERNLQALAQTHRIAAPIGATYPVIMFAPRTSST